MSEHRVVPGLLAGVGLALALAPVLPVDAAAEGEPTIRVLLLRADEAVEVREAGRSLRIRRAGPGVRVEGGPSAPLWRSRRSPVEVGAFTLRGVLEVRPHEGGLAVVNELPLEDYLLGTLGVEVYASWRADALRAQAVASRTYALHQRAQRRGRPWHVVAGTLSQVYGGLAAESPPVRDAVHHTRGEILTWEGRPILAAFHSASGGQTASSREVWGEARPYLRSLPVEDEWESPDTYWRVFLSRTTLRRAATALGHAIGDVREVAVLSRSESGRVARVRLTGEKGSAITEGRQLRRAVGESILKSTLFELRREGDGYRVVGSGNGHGVGMSQWGARALAETGVGYREILAAFYPGARLEGARALPPVAAGEAIPDLHERVADFPLSAPDRGEAVASEAAQ